MLNGIRTLKEFESLSIDKKDNLLTNVGKIRLNEPVTAIKDMTIEEIRDAYTNAKSDSITREFIIVYITYAGLSEQLPEIML